MSSLTYINILCRHAKEPFQPSQVIQVATPGHKAVTPRRINIIAAQFSKTMQDKLLLGYGSSFKSAFESMVSILFLSPLPVLSWVGGGGHSRIHT